MTWLVVFPEREPERRARATADVAVIERELARWGVQFERWLPDREHVDPLVAYASRVGRLRAAGYGTVDVVQLAPDAADPGWADKAHAMREKFRDEHTHAEDEVRFFTLGSGVFYLRLGGHVYCVGCHAGDLLSVPAGTRHWFDMGEAPRFVAIRFFKSASGWVGNFSGDAIARRFPSLDELAASAPEAAGVGAVAAVGAS